MQSKSFLAFALFASQAAAVALELLLDVSPVAPFYPFEPLAHHYLLSRVLAISTSMEDRVGNRIFEVDGKLIDILLTDLLGLTDRLVDCVAERVPLPRPPKRFVQELLGGTVCHSTWYT